MKKLILFFLCFLIFSEAFASSKKYSKETDRGYAGMLGCFSYMMETCNRTDEKDVVAKRQERENKLKQAHNNMGPKGKEMVECAFQEKMEKAKDFLEEVTRNGDYVNKMKCKMCIDELNRLKVVIGIK